MNRAETLSHKEMQFRFRLEIVILVILKIILLLIIKSLWFDDPVAPHMKVPLDRVEQHFFNRNNPTSPQSTGVQNDRPG